MISVKLGVEDINKRWLERASAATEAAIKDWEKWLKQGAKGEFQHEFDQRIWTAFKKMAAQIQIPQQVCLL